MWSEFLITTARKIVVLGVRRRVVWKISIDVSEKGTFPILRAVD